MIRQKIHPDRDKEIVNPTEFFTSLTPDIIIQSLESIGLCPTGRILPLNSMENRVYEIEIDPAYQKNQFVIAKFYRPGRWSEEQIAEELQFLWELAEREIPVVPALKFAGNGLFQVPEQSIYFALFPKQGGRSPCEMNDTEIAQLGRLIGRLHAVGAIHPAHHRLHLTTEEYGDKALSVLEQLQTIPSHFAQNYFAIARQLISTIRPLLAQIPLQRIHGDCHLGNILSNGEHFFLVDFDDMCMGPKIQDIWPIIPGRSEEDRRQRHLFLENYQTMGDFSYQDLKLIEPLRSLRLIHYNAWLAKRWEDPIFPRTFEFFSEPRYWEEQISILREQLSLIHEERENEWL